MLLLEVKAITDSNFTYVIGLSQQFLGGNGISPLHQNYPLIDRLAAKPSDFHAAILQTHSWRKSIKITNQQPTRRRRASVFPHAAKNEAQESVPIANQKVDTSPPAAQQDDSEPATTVQEPQDEDNTDTDDTNIDDGKGPFKYYVRQDQRRRMDPPIRANQWMRL
ncbi:hypothetical protein RvY_12225-3 [Ramazzottius varieornatus]|uniref:Uncharacterized protein n=1 Tax=Ramazzottius varieornatus TaxID=947166 RepID=A0A1D1VSJ9_RAMVA|nr:hypothetical protein RvY_12225-3 [Ramazzottius varieornatus]